MTEKMHRFHIFFPTTITTYGTLTIHILLRLINPTPNRTFPAHHINNFQLYCTRPIASFIPSLIKHHGTIRCSLLHMYDQHSYSVEGLQAQELRSLVPHEVLVGLVQSTHELPDLLHVPEICGSCCWRRQQDSQYSNQSTTPDKSDTQICPSN